MQRWLPGLAICALLSACGGRPIPPIPPVTARSASRARFPPRSTAPSATPSRSRTAAAGSSSGCWSTAGARSSIAGDVYDAKHLDDEDDPEADFTVTPIESPHCDADEQCLEGR
jgi:hypothetical protein